MPNWGAGVEDLVAGFECFDFWTYTFNDTGTVVAEDLVAAFTWGWGGDMVVVVWVVVVDVCADWGVVNLWCDDGVMERCMGGPFMSMGFTLHALTL